MFGNQKEDVVTFVTSSNSKRLEMLNEQKINKSSKIKLLLDLVIENTKYKMINDTFNCFNLILGFSFKKKNFIFEFNPTIYTLQNFSIINAMIMSKYNNCKFYSGSIKLNLCYEYRISKKSIFLVTGISLKLKEFFETIIFTIYNEEKKYFQNELRSYLYVGISFYYGKTRISFGTNIGNNIKFKNIISLPFNFNFSIKNELLEI